MALNFEENNNLSKYRSRAILGELERPRMLTMILKSGIVKTEKSAMIVLVLLAGVIFLVSIFIFMKSTSTPNPVPPPMMGADGMMLPTTAN